MSFRRYRQRTPMGYGQRHFFVVCGNEVWGIAAMVELTLNRYASRFGPLSEKRAAPLELHLAQRESENVVLTLRALEGRSLLHKYPTRLRLLELDRARGEDVGPYSRKPNWAALKKEWIEAREARLLKQWKRLWKEEEDLRDCRSFLRQIERALK